MSCITGTFEIHITIDPPSQTRLLVLIESLKSDQNHSWMIRPRMTQVSELYGVHPIQPMFACFMHGTDITALDNLKKLGDLFRRRYQLSTSEARSIRQQCRGTRPDYHR